MTTHAFVLSIVIVSLGQTALAQELGKQPAIGAEPTKATYLITGLHCPPCTQTVESSLSRTQGVRSIKVDWQTKTARVEFDEAALSAQKVAQLIAGTRHMMGSGMQYAGWLALKVPDLKDEASAKAVKDALSKVPGVTRVATYPAQHSVSVQFAAQGATTSRQLIEVLAAAGFKADNF